MATSGIRSTSDPDRQGMHYVSISHKHLKIVISRTPCKAMFPPFHYSLALSAPSLALKENTHRSEDVTQVYRINNGHNRSLHQRYSQILGRPLT